MQLYGLWFSVFFVCFVCFVVLKFGFYRKGPS